MRSIVLKYGLIAGAILGVFMFGAIPFHDQIGFGAAGMVVGYTGMVVAFLMIHAGMKSYRDTIGGGQVTYGQALTIGLLIMLIGCVIYVACWAIISNTIYPDFAEKYAQYALANARAEGKSAAEIAEITTQMNDFATSYKNPFIFIAWTMLEPLPVGLLFSFVSAWLVSRKSNPLAARVAAA